MRRLAVACVLLALATPTWAQMLLLGAGPGGFGAGGMAAPFLANSGPSSGTLNTASTNFTVTLSNTTFNGSQTATITDGSQGGTFTPSVGTCGSPSTCTVTPTNLATSFTFTYTPAVTGQITLTFTNAQSWREQPSTLTYTVSTAQGALPIGVP